jgi:hypothetical protein
LATRRSATARGAEHQRRQTFRRQSHQAATCRVDSHEIDSHDDRSHLLGSPIQRTVAFHADDDRQMGRFRQGDVDDAVGDAAPVQFGGRIKGTS